MLEKMQTGFFKFINVALMIIFIPIIIGAIIKGQSLLNTVGMIDIILLVVAILLVAIVILMQKKSIKTIYLVGFITLAGFLLRYLYICSIDSVPVSDYQTMMSAAKGVLDGQFGFFKETGYMARFPHLTMPTLYFSTVMSLTSNYLWIIKFINVLLSTINIVIVYFIGKELFESTKKAEWLAIAMAIFPPVIIYSATYAPENLAMPFYLLSIYILIGVVKNKFKPHMALVAGIILSCANLFRAVAMVMIVAFIIYIWVCNNNSVKNKLIHTAGTIIGFMIPMFIVSSLLLNNNITDTHLWVSAEPSITNILKGTNIESEGRWNAEDAKLVEDYMNDKEMITKKSKELIKERLTTTPPTKLMTFYYNKLVNQWKSGDFSAVYWAEHSVVQDDDQLRLSLGGAFYIQIFYIALLIFAYIGLFNKKQNFESKNINLFYIILGGYGMFYLISEAQERYAFIVCWLFIILAINGVDKVYRKFTKSN